MCGKELLFHKSGHICHSLWLDVLSSKTRINIRCKYHSILNMSMTGWVLMHAWRYICKYISMFLIHGSGYLRCVRMCTCAYARLFVLYHLAINSLSLFPDPFNFIKYLKNKLYLKYMWPIYYNLYFLFIRLQCATSKR